MANVLEMAAIKLGHPVRLGILMVSPDRLLHGALPRIIVDQFQ